MVLIHTQIPGGTTIPNPYTIYGVTNNITQTSSQNWTHDNHFVGDSNAFYKRSQFNLNQVDYNTSQNVKKSLSTDRFKGQVVLKRVVTQNRSSHQLTWISTLIQHRIQLGD